MNPWSRLNTEPLEAYEAFIDHLHLGEQEPVSDRYSPDQLRDWGLTYAWVERSARYHARRNREERAKASQSHSQEIQTYIANQNELSSSLSDMAGSLLERATTSLEANTEVLTIGQCIGLLRLTLELTKLSNDIRGRVLGINQLLKMRLKKPDMRVDVRT